MLSRGYAAAVVFSLVFSLEALSVLDDLADESDDVLVLVEWSVLAGLATLDDLRESVA